LSFRIRFSGNFLFPVISFADTAHASRCAVTEGFRILLVDILLRTLMDELKTGSFPPVSFFSFHLADFRKSCAQISENSPFLPQFVPSFL